MSGMGLSFSELCCLFCCPPCPSRIAAKLAFLPPEATYSFEEETCTENNVQTSEPGLFVLGSFLPKMSIKVHLDKGFDNAS